MDDWNKLLEIQVPSTEYALLYLDSRVPPATAWRDVAYVEQDGMYARCDLCDTGWMMKHRVIGTHTNGRKHGNQHRLLCQEIATLRRQTRMLEFGSRFEETEHVRELVDRNLSLEAHRAAVHQQLLFYIASGSPGLLDEARCQVEQYGRVEIVVALDLALFKASLRPEFASMEELRTYPVLAPGFDPMNWGRARRATNGSAAVVRLILEHLAA